MNKPLSVHDNPLRVSTGLLQDTFDATAQKMRTAQDNHLGYPYNLSFSPGVPDDLWGYLINNLGDPYAGSHYGAEVCDLERAAIRWLMDLWGCDDPAAYRGAVGASGTEGNLWGIYLGREALPDAVLLHSADAHYSIPKAARIQRVPAIEVQSNDKGEVDLTHLADVVASLQGRAIILALTCGTTMKGAHDDILGAVTELDLAGYDRNQRYIHVDGALNAMVVQFLPAAPLAIQPSFAQAIDSISTSGHKMIGTPMPCGAIVCRKEHSDRIARAVAYLRSNDTTLMGGHAVLAIWARLMGHGYGGFSHDALRCTLRAQGLTARLRASGIEVLCNRHGMTVVFPEPELGLVKTCQLACTKGQAHAIVMPNVTEALLDRFAADYVRWHAGRRLDA